MRTQQSKYAQYGFYVCLMAVIGLSVAVLESQAGLLNRIGGSSASSLGMAGAGEASAFHPGAQNVFLNPAGMVTVDGVEIYIGDISIFTDIEYKRDISKGGGTFDASKDIFQFPELAVAWRLDDHWILGADMWVPYGLAADLEQNLNLAKPFFHRQSEIFIAQGSIALAYQFNKEFSLGASLDIDYAKMGFHLPVQLSATSILSPYTQGDGFDVGASFGALWTPGSWRFGIKYSLPVSVDVDGDTNFATNAGLGKRDFKTEINVPQRLTAGAAYDINDIWSMAFDTIYTDYGKNDVLVINYAALPDKSLPLKWGDIWSFRLGNSLKMTDKLTWEQGVGYVLSGAPDNYMMPSVPDAAGISVTTGVKYDWNQRLSTYLSADYTWGKRDIGANWDAAGEINASLFVIGAGVNYKF